MTVEKMEISEAFYVHASYNTYIELKEIATKLNASTSGIGNSRKIYAKFEIENVHLINT